MKDTNFTKGPWVVGTSMAVGFTHCVDTGYGCEPTGLPNEIAAICPDRHGDNWDQETKSNAHLISVAPSYYEAVEGLLSNSSFVANFPEEAEQLETLQSKARGESYEIV